MASACRGNPRSRTERRCLPAWVPVALGIAAAGCSVATAPPPVTIVQRCPATPPLVACEPCPPWTATDPPSTVEGLQRAWLRSQARYEGCQAASQGCADAVEVWAAAWRACGDTEP